MVKQRAFDTIGNIAIVNFDKGAKLSEKKKFANRLLKNQKNIITVLEKTGKVKGRLRKPTIRYLSGEKTKEVKYKENNCIFRFNIDSTYFSPRLSNERKEIAGKIKKGEEVLVMFAGVAPFSIVIAKNSKAKKVYSNEINREANKYAKLNIELNNLKNKVELVPGDVKRVVEKMRGSVPDIRQGTSLKKSVKTITNSLAKKSVSSDFRATRSRAKRGKLPKFDVIVMPRPQLKNSFLKEAFSLSKKGTRIFYYDFCSVGEEKETVQKIKKEAKENKENIKILKIKKAGEIAPYKIRLRVDFKIV